MENQNKNKNKIGQIILLLIILIMYLASLLIVITSNGNISQKLFIDPCYSYINIISKTISSFTNNKNLDKILNNSSFVISDDKEKHIYTATNSDIQNKNTLNNNILENKKAELQIFDEKNPSKMSSNIKRINLTGASWHFDEKQNAWNLVFENDNTIAKDSIYIIDYVNPITLGNCTSTYCFDENGKALVGWGIDEESNYYYFDDNIFNVGKMCTGWKKVEDDYYYFSIENGRMLKNTFTPDGFFVDENGKYIQNAILSTISITSNNSSTLPRNKLESNQNQQSILFSKEEKFKYICHLMDNLNLGDIIMTSEEDGRLSYNYFSFYVDKNGNIIKDLREKINSNDYAIAVNRSKKIVTIYAWDDITENYSIPLVSFPCTPNKEKTTLGIHYISNKYRWKDLYGGHWGQYVLRFDEHQLFHSVLYSKPNIYSLEVETYNGINKGNQSSGCIRLRTGDAYWMYNNIEKGTIVYVYDGFSSNPYGREDLIELDSNIKFDPTDPEISFETN